MTKSDLICSMADTGVEGNKITKAHCKEMLDLLQSCMIEALANGEEIFLSGFGTFNVSVREARVGRNPKTGEKIDIPETKIVTFKPAKSLKETVNK